MIGTAVNHWTIKNQSELLVKHFNCMTCENEMKYSSVAIHEGEYDFTYADQIVEFAKNHNMAVRGHTFVWHNQTPDWVFKDANKSQLLHRIKNHISLVGKRYQNDIFCWDVVNEAIEDKSGQVLRNSKWKEILGDTFMDQVFLLAKEILPNTKLFYNDYNETNPEKRQKIYETIHGMKQRGVPIDGIGMQCHNNIFAPTQDELKRTIELYASLGLKIHITEMDVSLFEFDDHSSITKPSKQLLEQQANVYADSFQIFREYKDVIDCVTLWGMTDHMSWLNDFPVPNRKNWPLLFDEELKPKEAFYRILEF